MKKTSVTVTMAAVIFSMVLIVLVGIAAPWLVKWFAELRGISKTVRYIILWAYYFCAAAAELALFWLYKLLRNIKTDRMFDPVNPRYMRRISWFCAFITGYTFVCGFWYPPFFFVTAAMLFLCLIVSVVRLCFIAATEIKEENDLTI